MGHIAWRAFEGYLLVAAAECIGFVVLFTVNIRRQNQKRFVKSKEVETAVTTPTE